MQEEKVYRTSLKVKKPKVEEVPKATSEPTEPNSTEAIPPQEE